MPEMRITDEGEEEPGMSTREPVVLNDADAIDEWVRSRQSQPLRMYAIQCGRFGGMFGLGDGVVSPPTFSDEVELVWHHSAEGDLGDAKEVRMHGGITIEQCWTTPHRLTEILVALCETGELIGTWDQEPG